MRDVEGVTIMGRLPDDVDDRPCSPPAGFIWMLTSCAFNEHHGVYFARCRVSVGSETLDFVMTDNDLHALRQLIDRVEREHDEFRDDEDNLKRVFVQDRV